MYRVVLTKKGYKMSKTATITASEQLFIDTSGQQTVIAIDESQLVAMLRANKGANFVTVVTKTDPKMRKTGNPFVGKMFKVSRVNCMIGWSYANSVNNQRQREGNTDVFVAEPRKWGTRIDGTPLIEHKGQFYVELKVEKSLDAKYIGLDGKELDAATLADAREFFSKPRRAATQQTDKEIILRDYKVASIVAITMNKQAYIVRR